ncbi:MAG: hypothetical protein JXA99_08855 [Candidatus Lokiarchaeota archaeon]|nr:hypothetical protein [Candidatus Lokiarchaeota archaeon]
MIFLCLGNSLTSGYPGYSPSIDGISEGYGNPQSQYEYWLKEFCLDYLNNEFLKLNENSKVNIEFVNKGIPGELTDDLFRRIDTDLIHYIPKPSYSIILGGSNDLGWNSDVDKIFNNIKQLHIISRNNGIISIGATIPPIRGENFMKGYNKKKSQLNQKLKGYFIEYNIPYADLDNGMADAVGDLKKEYANPDGIHFTVKGYYQMASVIFKEAVKKIVSSNYSI